VGSDKATAYSRAEVRRILKINENRLRSWERMGLCKPQQRFEFADLIALKTLQKLRENRIPAERIEQSLESLRAKLSGIDHPLWELKIVSDGRKVAVELPGGKMEALTGQMLFNFEASTLRPVAEFEVPKQPQDDLHRVQEAELWFQKGLELEEQGEPPEAIIEAYTKALELNPKAAGAWINIGTVHYREGDLREAEFSYRQGLKAYPDYALAHFNLGNICEEMGRLEEADEHYAAAIALDGGYSDAHYNLALVKERLDQPMAAAKHWRCYLNLDPASPWSHIARQQLDTLLKVTKGGGAVKPRVPQPINLGG